jgi:DNA replication ATP-dependent helicase Dna2
MHPEIAGLPNRLFYNDKLKSAALKHQEESLQQRPVESNDLVGKVLCNHRMVFIPSAFSAHEVAEKSNHLEARVISKVLSRLVDIHEFTDDSEIIEKTGIITPYRNQIACIREQLEADGFTCFDTIQVDTVERFQGSQKDFILVSLCMNRARQLDFLVQSRVSIEDKSGNGMLPELVDRKLNVMLTRARKQLVIIGNEAVLGGDEIYGEIINDIRDNGGYIQKGARFVVEG